MSRRFKCGLYIVRCAAPKHVFHDTTDSKGRISLQKIHFGHAVATGSYGRLAMPAENDVANLYLVISSHVMPMRRLGIIRNEYCFCLGSKNNNNNNNPTRSKWLSSAPKRLLASTSGRTKTKLSSAKHRSSSINQLSS